MNNKKRPDWPFNITYEEALWIYQTFVTSVSLEFDNSGPCYILRSEKCELCETIIIQSTKIGSSKDNSELFFTSSLINGMVGMVTLRSDVEERVRQILIFEEKQREEKHNIEEINKENKEDSELARILRNIKYARYLQIVEELLEMKSRIQEL